MTLFLRQQGIDCPKPVMNIFGKYNSIEKIGESTHLVRLLEFVPGRIFNDVLKTKHLFFQAGEFVAKIDSALKRFTHDALENNKSVWQVEELPQLTKFLYAVNDPQRQALVQKVMAEFKSNVLDHYSEFARGVIHGDCNEHNIVVTKDSPTSDEFRVSGIIDFGDSSKTLYVFELAITLSYMLLQSCTSERSCELETAGYVIAGYQQIRLIPQHERSVLKVNLMQSICILFSLRILQINVWFYFSFSLSFFWLVMWHLSWVEQHIDMHSCTIVSKLSAWLLQPHIGPGQWLYLEFTGERMENFESNLGHTGQWTWGVVVFSRRQLRETEWKTIE